MQATRWWLIRHAPVPNHGIIYGQMDLPADTSDSLGFQNLAQLLPRQAQWITTPLQRTRQTAEAIWAHLDETPAEPEVSEGLIEQSFGDWQGLTFQELEARRPDFYHRFWRAPAHQAPPGGESFADLVARTGTALHHFNQRFQGQDIICVTHGGTIRAALAVALKMAPERALSFSVTNSSLTRLTHYAEAPSSHEADHDESWAVELVNFPPQSSV